jgi:hypothetical protein
VDEISSTVLADKEIVAFIHGGKQEALKTDLAKAKQHRDGSR